MFTVWVLPCLCDTFSFRTQSALLKKTEDAEGDAAELSATKVRVQQLSSNAMVVVSQPPSNGSMFSGVLTRSSSAPRDMV